MNKISTISLSILGAVDVVVNVATPILLALFWVKLFGLNDMGSYLMYGIGLVATIFRGIKFWIKKE